MTPSEKTPDQPTPAPPPMVAQARTAKFTFGKIVWLIVVAAVGLNLAAMLVREFTSKGEEPFEYYHVSRACGAGAAAVVQILFLYGLGWVAYRLARRDVIVGRVVVAALGLLFLSGASWNGLRTYQQLHATDRMAAAHQSMDELRQANARQLDENGYVKPDLDKLGDIQHELTGAFDAMSDDQRTAGHVLIEFNDALIALAGKYQAAVAALQEADGFNPKSITDVATLDHRIELVDAIVACSKEISEMIGDAPEKLAARMKERGVPDRISGPMLAAATAEMHLDQALELRRLDDAVFQAQRDEYELLKAQWGHWKCHEDPNDVKVYFERGQASREYNDLIAKKKALSEQCAELMRAMVRAQQSQGGG